MLSLGIGGGSHIHAVGKDRRWVGSELLQNKCNFSICLRFQNKFMVLSRYQVHSRLQSVGVLFRIALLVYLVCLQKLIQYPTASVKALGVTLSRQREQRMERPAQTQCRSAPHACPAAHLPPGRSGYSRRRLECSRVILCPH